MPEFTYEAITTSGQRSVGNFTAGSEREVMAMLDARGLYPLRIAQARAAAGGVLHRKRRIKSRNMATFFSQLADLLHSGVPLLRSLDILERQSTQPALSEVVREVRAAVADGTSLADSMGRHPEAFSELAVSMVRAGQEGGFLEDVLRRIADFTENQEDLKSKVAGAMAYPMVLSIVGVLVITILVVFVVPRFEPMFKLLEEKGEMPTLTVWLLTVSHFLLGPGGIVVLVVIVGAVFGYVAWSKTPSGRMLLDGWRLRMWGVGPVYLSYALARFTRILGTMLHNGIPILQALRIAKDSTGNKVLALAIEKSAESITGGDKLATPLAASKYFPRDVIEMIAVGEESNSLDKVLVDIANGLEKRTTRQLDLFVRLLEPIMLLIMALLVGVVLAALLMPVFKMGSAVS